MRFWYISHMQSVMTQISLCKIAVSWKPLTNRLHKVCQCRQSQIKFDEMSHIQGFNLMKMIKDEDTVQHKYTSKQLQNNANMVKNCSTATAHYNTGYLRVNSLPRPSSERTEVPGPPCFILLSDVRANIQPVIADKL